MPCSRVERLLFVSDAAQGMGVGTALFDHLKSFASFLQIEAIRSFRILRLWAFTGGLELSKKGSSRRLVE
jgi:GNAT superfamily N-acetyltransferase